MKGPRGECYCDGEVTEGRGGDRGVTVGFGGGRHGEGARVVAEEVFCGHSPTGRKYPAATAICHSHSSMQLHVFILLIALYTETGSTSQWPSSMDDVRKNSDFDLPPPLIKFNFRNWPFLFPWCFVFFPSFFEWGIGAKFLTQSINRRTRRRWPR